ncbi:phenylacetate--CoA ligase family protein [Brevibacillus dissolubilis]|uniref:phenylacetate--CoA ligase family protein n=1 Tax=Brevibacillus dissolubilis TaxID=1844116 RepID=UPI00111771FC|nr:AMP-binding protein [Brevibacillus dissolubilis]
MDAHARLYALQKVLAHSKSSAFYRQRIPDAPIESLADFRQIPLLTKDDVRSQSPFGLVCAPRERLFQYHESSGTTGTPSSVWFTKRDLAQIHQRISRCGVQFTPQDIVLIRFPYALSTISHMMHQTAQMQDACVVPADSRTTITPLPSVVRMLKQLQVSVLCCLSLNAVMIAEMAEMLGYDPKADFPYLRAICTAGEPLSPARRRLLTDIWGVPVYDNYGMTETGTIMVECEHHQAHIFDDLYHIEVLADDLTTEAAPGEIGHLVITTLQERATPMIRYLTGDRVRLIHQPCACGEPTTLHVYGRSADTLTIQGGQLDLWHLEEIVGHLPCRRFWAVAPTAAGLHYLVEQEREGVTIPTDLKAKLEQTYQIALTIELVPKGTLYDRREPMSFGMAGKPKYICTPDEITNLKA